MTDGGLALSHLALFWELCQQAMYEIQETVGVKRSRNSSVIMFFR